MFTCVRKKRNMANWSTEIDTNVIMPLEDKKCSERKVSCHLDNFPRHLIKGQLLLYLIVHVLQKFDVNKKEIRFSPTKAENGAIFTSWNRVT